MIIKKKYWYLMLCIAWMGVIFWFSMQVGSTSQGMSDTLLKMIDKFFNTRFLQGQESILQGARFFVRKGTHIGEYTILALLLSAYLRETQRKKYVWKALAGVFLYACSDEIHQLFVMHRSGRLSDVGIDMIGGCLGVTLHMAYWKFRERTARFSK